MSNLPLVTVIMPIRNEGRYIEQSLSSVLAQDYPSHCMEILVVDGMSTDSTREILSRFPVRVLDNPARIVSTALNIGLEHARGNVIIRVDGHCEIGPSYVRRCVKVLQETGADCVGGAIVTVGDTWMAQAIAAALSSPWGVGTVAFRTGRAHPGFVDTVAFGAYRRETFERIGGFDEGLTRHQDYELNLRLRQSGGKIYYTPEIKVRYYSRGTLTKLARQYFQYGFWKWRVTRENPQAFTWRHLAPSSLALTVVLGALLSLVFSWAHSPYALLWLLYGATVLGASVHVSARRGWRNLPILPLTLVTIHLSWGLGFWWGVIRRSHSGTLQGRTQLPRRSGPN